MADSVQFVKDKWDRLTSFCNKQEVKDRLWEEIVYRYTGANRYFHNLNLIAYKFSLCDKYLSEIKNTAVFGFATLYHDIIFDVFRNDNEEQSAEIAALHLQKLRLNNGIIDQVKLFIRSTNPQSLPEHIAPDSDLALFLDFDVAILGEDDETYKLYSTSIRLEYQKFNDILYNKGRKEALSKMLSSGLFHTRLFKGLMEDKAVRNISEEISRL